MLHYIHIYFDFPKYDRITKDSAAKFVDKLSAIDGTMGLLTGFSLISLVEIVYFSANIFWFCQEEIYIINFSKGTSNKVKNRLHTHSDWLCTIVMVRLILIGCVGWLVL